MPDQRQPVLLAVDRTIGPFQPASGAVGVDPDHQHIAKLPRPSQKLDVTGVQQIEDAIGEDDRLAGVTRGVQAGGERAEVGAIVVCLRSRARSG